MVLGLHVKEGRPDWEKWILWRKLELSLLKATLNGHHATVEPIFVERLMADARLLQMEAA